MMQRRAQFDRGFTLFELVILVAIIGSLLALASLNASAFLSHYRAGSAARQVATDLRMARTKAVTQGVSFRVVFAAGGSYTADRRDPTSGEWQPHALLSKGTVAGAATPISLPAPVRITSADTVTFEPRGNALSTHTISLSDPGMGGGIQTVSVRLSGRVSVP